MTTGDATVIQPDQVWYRTDPRTGQRQVFTVERVGRYASTGVLAVVGSETETQTHVWNAGLQHGWALATGERVNQLGEEALGERDERFISAASLLEALHAEDAEEEAK